MSKTVFSKYFKYYATMTSAFKALKYIIFFAYILKYKFDYKLLHMNKFIISFIILFGTFFISRIIIEKATKKLDQDKKAALIDLFSKARVYSFGITIGLMILFWVSLNFNLSTPWIDMGLIFMLTIIMSYFSYKKLKVNNFPATYIKSYLLSTLLRLFALMIFFVLLKF